MSANSHADTAPAPFVPFSRRIVLGRCNSQGTGRRDPGDVAIDVRVEATPRGPRLSICGDVWQRNKRDIVAAGQMRDGICDYLTGPGDECRVSTAFLDRLVAVWDRWHLNDMNAGCAHQRALGWEPTPYGSEAYTNGADCVGKPCPECGYRYGSAWLYEALPDGLVDEIRNWPALPANPVTWEGR